MCFSETPTPKKPSKTPDGSKPGGGAEEPCHPACTLASETLATSPPDRTRTKVGVGEEVFLTVTGNAATWAITSGSGTLTPNTGTHNSVTFIAGELNESVTITATCSGCSCVNTIIFTVVQPSGWTMVQKPGSGIRHKNGVPSTGFLGNMYLQPTDVNFYNTENRELDSLSVGAGSYHPSHHGKYHGGYPPPDRASGWFQITRHNTTDGSTDGGDDQIWTGYPPPAALGASPPPFNVGTYYWEITMQWRVVGSANIYDFPVQRQESEIFADGRCEIRKGGITKSTIYSDADSSW